MKTILKLAWRNLWRNKRRTLIAISSVFFAALMCMLLKSLMEGSTNYIINTTIERQTGTFQIMSSEYWNDKTVDNFIAIDENTMKKWEAIPNVKRMEPRMEVFAMAWNGTRTKPISLIGIDPAREIEFSKLNTRMKQGKFLSQHDNGIIVGSKYAEVMKLAVGDTLALVGQGFHGSNAAGLFIVKGIVKSFDPLQDAGCAYTSLAAARNFIDMPDGETYISVVLNNTNKIDETITTFKKSAGENNSLAYRSWQELIAETAAGAASDKKSMGVYFNLLYVVVGFGLLSTMIMLTNERRKEFGVMTTLGMKKRNLIGGLFIEMFFINLLGLLAAVLIAFPIILYFHFSPIHFTGEMGKSFEDLGYDPIMPFDISANLFLSQVMIVACIAMIITLYPYMKIMRMNIIDALRK
jgi:ABC-type lipoprotein release transport system permease subunit